MKVTVKGIKSTSLALLLVMSVFAGGFVGTAAAAAYELETSTASDWQDDGNTSVADFNASADQNSTVEFLTNNGTSYQSLEIDISVDNESHHSLTDADPEYTLAATNNTDGDDVHQFVINHDELSTVPAEINEDVKINVTITMVKDGATDVTNEFQVTLQNTDERSVIYAGQKALDNDIASVEEVDRWFGLLDAESHATVEDERLVNGSKTEIVVVLADADVADNFADAAEDADDGDWLVMMGASSLDGDLVKIYNEEVGDDVDEDDDTYGVYNSSTDTITFTLGEDYEDRKSVDVLTVGNDKPDFWAVYDAFGFSDAWNAAMAR